MLGACALSCAVTAGAAATALNAPETAVRASDRVPASTGSAAARPAPAAAPAPPPGHSSAGHPKARSSACGNEPTPPPVRQITRPQWLGGVVITEYYPAPERWFVGRRVSAPGLSGTHAVDWLYSAHGLAMEGDGVDARGRPFHIAQLGSTAWVNSAGGLTEPVCLGKWTDGAPAWLSGGWRNAHGQVTFPLAGGGWSNGAGDHQLSYGGVTFAPGASLPLRYYHSIAVDPRLIPLGSRAYIPAYRHLGGGWFVAQDTGGAIKGAHVDVYRPAPSSPSNEGRYMTGQRIYVVPAR